MISLDCDDWIIKKHSYNGGVGGEIVQGWFIWDSKNNLKVADIYNNKVGAKLIEIIKSKYNIKESEHTIHSPKSGVKND